MPICHKILPLGHGRAVSDQIVLDYDGRMLRRKRLETVAGVGFMVDLPETMSLNEGDAFELIDGRVIGVIAADELVAIVTGNLPRLAWHIGNRHTPCQVTETHLVIRRDPVLEKMVVGLGGQIRTAIEPFRPEGGAYGHGRTMGHGLGGHDHA